MNQNELASKLSKKLRINVKVAHSVIGSVWDSVYDALAAGQDIKLGKVGKIVVAVRGKRVGRNPMTGEEYELPAHNCLKIVLSGKLKRALVAAPLVQRTKGNHGFHSRPELRMTANAATSTQGS